MVPRRFSWPFGGQRASFCGSFTGWAAGTRSRCPEAGSFFHCWRECPMGLVGTEFQVVFDLPPGLYQETLRLCSKFTHLFLNILPFIPIKLSTGGGGLATFGLCHLMDLAEADIYRFLVDGVWRCDDTKPIVRDEYGLISNEMLVTLVENNTHPAVQLEPSPIRRMNLDEGTILTTMPPEPPSRNPGMQIAVFRHRVSEILLHNTIYDVVPVSSKIAILDARLPVKQAFNIMHDEGLALVPLWDDGQGTVTGMLTASDFVLILRKLQRNIRVLGHEELEMHSVSAWKEAKLQYYGGADVAGMQRRPLVHFFAQSSKNNQKVIPFCEIRFPVFLLVHGRSILEGQVISTLNSADRISSIPIVDDNGSLLDVYSLSDIMALAENDVYACIELEQLTVENALELQYQVNGRRQCHTCLSTSTLLEVLDQLSVPGVRRLVVIEPMTRFVQGIISLRDTITFLVG
uniref:Uncharacterized protein n=1 Tax=Aegilops tauschii TaxID=37682 RepID=R7WEG0_AEGTA